MDLDLFGKTVLVGGASRGIGFAIASAFLDEGANVTITGRNADALEDARGRLAKSRPDAVHAVSGDLGVDATIVSALDETIERWSRIDAVVANVGSGRATTGWSVSEQEWHDVFQTNFGSSRKLVDAAMPHLIASGSGSVVMTGSIAGLESIQAPIPYSVAKSALASYCKNLARSVGREGVRVNCVSPGNVYFEGGTWDRKLQEDESGVRAYLDAEVPLNRFATPQEIADIVVFLSSPRAGFVTGACVVADGGQTRGGYW